LWEERPQNDNDCIADITSSDSGSFIYIQDPSTTISFVVMIPSPEVHEEPTDLFSWKIGFIYDHTFKFWNSIDFV
jgi:hypothetical protein